MKSSVKKSKTVKPSKKVQVDFSQQNYVFPAGDEIKQKIQKFRDFSLKEISSAVEELSKISSDANRKHLQRLVYVNIVNRFDSLVDSLLVYCSTSGSAFTNTVLNKVKEEPVNLKTLYEITLSKDPTKVTKKKVEDIVRSQFLNARHSKKLNSLLHECLGMDEADLKKPRVNANNGRILTTYTKRIKSTPPSIIGYADWLYSRRNALVHNDKLSILDNDANYMRKNFQISPSKMVGIKLSSIESAQTFYDNLCGIMIESIA